jgi:hypothetical protein
VPHGRHALGVAACPTSKKGKQATPPKARANTHTHTHKHTHTHTHTHARARTRTQTCAPAPAPAARGGQPAASAPPRWWAGASWRRPGRHLCVRDAHSATRVHAHAHGNATARRSGWQQRGMLTHNRKRCMASPLLRASAAPPAGGASARSSYSATASWLALLRLTGRPSRPSARAAMAASRAASVGRCASSTEGLQPTPADSILARMDVTCGPEGGMRGGGGGT